MPSRLLLLLALLSLRDGWFRHGDLAAQTPRPAAVWTDPAPHQIRFLRVTTDVQLELLDFGGSGPPVVFLSGLGDTGHSFDEFAPKFTDHWHVYAITRRGYGASSHPDSGYGMPRLAEDVRTVLDSLGLRNVTLIGHSLGGDELTRIAATWPERISKLVYLDAAHDRVALLDSLIGPDWPEDPPMTAADSVSPEAVRAYLATVYGFRLNEAEVHEWFEYDTLGHMIRQRTPDSVGMKLILPHVEHPAYARIRARVLAFYDVPTSAEAMFPRFRSSDSTYQARAIKAFIRSSEWTTRERERLRLEVPGARIIELRDSNHYVFVVSEAEVLRETRRFLLER